MNQKKINETLTQIHDVLVKNKATMGEVIVMCEYLKYFALQSNEVEE